MKLLTPAQFAHKHNVPKERIDYYIKRQLLPVVVNENLNHPFINETELTDKHYEQIQVCEPRWPENVMEMIRQRLDLEEDDASRDDEINAMSPMEAFEHVLLWEGIIGHTYYIVQWVNDLFNVNLEDHND